MNNSNLLSIIIPVFNGANTLSRCVESIENTSKRDDISIIIADDGSTDESLELEQGLVEKYTNITILKLPHKGVVDARHTALKTADTDYIWFVDADDYVVEGATDIVVDAIVEKKTDIIAFSHKLKCGNQENLMKQILKPGVYDRAGIEREIIPYIYHDFRQKSFRKPVLDGFLWNKVFKRNLILDYICTDGRIKLFEDVLSITAAVFYANSLYCIDAPLYVYVKEDSVTTNYRDDYFYNTYLCKEYLAGWIGLLPTEWHGIMAQGSNAFIVERLIVSITREMRFKKSIKLVKPFVKGELDKYPIVKELRYKGLPFVIKCYLLLLKLHFYTLALWGSKIMA